MENTNTFFFSALNQRHSVLESIQHSPSFSNTFEKISNLCITQLNAGKKILFFGNGGSATDSQHLATEFIVRFQKNRRPLAALALSSDAGALTAAGNDFGFETIFERQLQALGKEGDIAFALSTSGNSANVLRAVECANAQKIFTVAFTGIQGALQKMTTYSFSIPTHFPYLIQEITLCIGHMLCQVIEEQLCK